MPATDKLPLHRKAEVVLAGYVQAATRGVPRLRRYQIRQAGQIAEGTEQDIVIRCKAGEELFAGGPRIVSATIYIGAGCDESETGELPGTAQRRRERVRHDEAVQAAQAAFEDRGALLAFCNAGAPGRPVERFHVYDCTPEEGEGAFEGRKFGDVLAFKLQCEEADYLPA